MDVVLSHRIPRPGCIRACRTRTVGQVIGAYVVLAFMLTLGSPLLAMLFFYRLVMRRQMNNGPFVHKYTNTVVSAAWWLHNKLLRYVLGSGC